MSLSIVPDCLRHERSSLLGYNAAIDKPENTMKKTSFRKHRVERFSSQQVTRQRKKPSQNG
jgi:hypothetical protein